MNRRGFTIVELLIVIAILGILLVLGVVNLRGSQVSARDTERRVDVETLATHLETYYMNGAYGTANDQGGTYPSTFTGNDSISGITTTLPDLDIKNIQSPSITDPAQDSLVAATTNLQSVVNITPVPSLSNDVYVYQPLRADNSLCTAWTQGCQKFNLYYFQESDGTVQRLKSKNQ